jgi:hypothetical protein
MVLLYLSFDWLPTWQKELANAIIKKHYLDVVIGPNRKRFVKNFVEKHISDVLNNERKCINEMTDANCKIRFTITRQGMELEKGIITKTCRKKKFFYKWMIIGNLVSNDNVLKLNIFEGLTFFCKQKVNTELARRRKYRRAVHAFVRDNTGPAARYAATIATHTNNEYGFNVDNTNETIEESDGNEESDDETVASESNAPMTWKQQKEKEMMENLHHQLRQNFKGNNKKKQCKPDETKRKFHDNDDDETMISTNPITPKKNTVNDDIEGDTLLDGYSIASPETVSLAKNMINLGSHLGNYSYFFLFNYDLDN